MKPRRTLSKTLGLIMVSLFSVFLVSHNNLGFFANAEENTVKKQDMPRKASDLDLKYKAAYDATMTAIEKANKHGVNPYIHDNANANTSALVNAVKGGMQKDINTARDAILALPEGMETAIGEFSKLLDGYQHPVYERIVTIINEMKMDDDKLAQKEINAVRTLIVEAPDFIDSNNNPAKASYSSALDVCQIRLHNRAQGLVNRALETRNESDIKKARQAIEELKTNEFLDSNIKTLIAGLESKLDDTFDVIGIE